MNHLYFGDCLQILKQLHNKNPQGFIDLIYIDPPFNSARNYNVLFESVDLKDANAQKQAFADTWSNVSYVDSINELAELNKDVHVFLKTLGAIKTSDSSVAYLSTMAIRIYYMHKCLKDTGSFYLHCDPTMSHYLKVICDLIFLEKNFRSEIIWKRTLPHGNVTLSLGNSHDVILFFTKTENAIWNRPFQPHRPEYIAEFYKYKDTDGRIYRLVSLINPNPDRPNLNYEWKGIRRVWKWTKERMEESDKKGIIVYSKNGIPSYKNYLDEMKGVPMQDLWEDIAPLMGNSEERLGYPTQKPTTLLERIIHMSSNEGDLVADFFCGCGTTVAAAQKLNRKWLGVDISHLAIRLIAKRLVDTYGEGIKHNFKIDGFPQDIGSAKMLARETDKGRFNFQDWVIEVLLMGVVNEKKVADGGYDGYLTFEIAKNKKEFVLIEVKSGNVNVKNVREFIQVVEHQKGSMGIFVCFEEQVTKDMTKAAKLAGNYHYAATGYEAILIRYRYVLLKI